MAAVACCGEALINDIEAAEVTLGSLAFWWLGQNGYAFKGGDTIVYADLYLSDPEDGRRQTPPPLTPDQVTNATVVTCSHDHGDHLDPGTVPGVVAASPQALFVAPRTARRRMLDLGVPAKRLVLLSHGESATLGPLTVTAVKSKHEFFDEDPAAGFPYLGFIYRLNGVTWYHAGDTIPWEGLGATLRGFAPEIVFLPINGRDAERYRRHCLGNCTFQEAVDLAGAVQPRMVVPMHWDMFAGNSEDPRKFVDYLAAKYPGVATWIGKVGEPVMVSAVG